MMNGRWLSPANVAEADELEFRYRSLLAAQRILDEQEAASPATTRFQSERLRRLRLYIQNSIAAVERQMETLGLSLSGSEGAENLGPGYRESMSSNVSNR